MLKVTIDDRIRHGVLTFENLQHRDGVAKEMTRLGFEVRRSVTRRIDGINEKRLTDPDEPKWLYAKWYRLEFHR